MLKKYRPYLLIVFIGVLLYAWTAFFDFSYFDDQALLIENSVIIGDVSNIGRLFVDDAFFSKQNFYYRPLLNLSFMLDMQVAGTLPWFFHLMNSFLHILAACLLFAVLRKLGAPKLRSLWLSLFILVHPALVQAVAWIPGRNDSILAIFILSSFWFFLSFLDRPRVAAFAASLLFFLAALFTKEVAVVIPVLFAFYYLFLTDKKMSRSDIGMFILGSTGALILWFLLRQLAIDGELGGWPAILLAVVENSPAAIINFGKFFFPFNLAIMPVMADVTILYGLAAIILLALAARFKLIVKGWLAFGLVWFVAFTLPAFINPNPEEFYYLLLLEHRLYLPFFGLIFILKDFTWPYFVRKFSPPVLISKAITVFSVLVLVIFFVLSALHLPNFKDRLSFWEFAAERSPRSPLAHRNLGAMLYFEDRLDDAAAAYHQALQLNPQERMAHNNLGVIYLDRNELEAAEEEFRLELAVNPGYEVTLANIQRLLILKNQLR